MFKLSLSLFVLLCTQSESLQNLCANKKAEGSCFCNRVTDRELNLPVTIVDCARINLQDFPDETQLIDDMNYLDLSFNSISKLDSKKGQEFSSESLETLSISHNEIIEISEDFFSHLPNLQKLDMSHNKIKQFGSDNIFENLPNLIYLDLSFNDLTTLPNSVFTHQKSLRFLDLSYNNLGKLLMRNNSNNVLGEDLGLNENATHLLLNNLGLKDLKKTYFDNFPDLKYLSIADNDFVTIPKVPDQLEYLDVSGNDMTAIEIGQLSSYHSLKNLKLNRLKQLESIHKYAFYNLISLEVLSISDCNNLKELDSEVFGLIAKSTKLSLRKLSLARNSLKTLNYTYGYLFDHLDFIDIRNNPWKCDCDLLWLREHYYHLYDNDDVRCSLPSALNKKKVSEIAEDDVPDCFPEKYGKKSHRIIIPILIISIVILFGLIGYLVYYAPNLGNRSRGLGPQSPYNPTRLVEEF